MQLSTCNSACLLHASQQLVPIGAAAAACTPRRQQQPDCVWQSLTPCASTLQELMQQQAAQHARGNAARHSHSNDVSHGQHKDLAVADLAGVSSGGDDSHHLVYLGPAGMRRSGSSQKPVPQGVPPCAAASTPCGPVVLRVDLLGPARHMHGTAAMHIAARQAAGGCRPTSLLHPYAWPC